MSSQGSGLGATDCSFAASSSATAAERTGEHIGGSARGYLAVGGACQQSRYGLLDGRLFCIFIHRHPWGECPHLSRTGAALKPHASGRHVCNVSAETLCARFHKPFPRKTRVCPQAAQEHPLSSRESSVRFCRWDGWHTVTGDAAFRSVVAAHEGYRVQCGGTAMLSPRPSTTVRAGHWREVDERSA
jgi:hypothetical protein